jgi:hypothetical protein
MRDSLNLEGRAPVFIYPRNRVDQLNPQALGSIFVASYGSQVYGGGIRTCFHRDIIISAGLGSLLYSLGADPM